MAPTHEDWMRRAIALATENVRELRGGPFGAVIVRDNLLVAEGANQVTATSDPTAHGEIVAIRAAGAALQSFTLAGCTLYSSAEPCPMCLAAIHWARIDRFFYGNSVAVAEQAGFDDAKLYREFTLAPALRSVPAIPLLADEAAASFALWQRSPLRVHY